MKMRNLKQNKLKNESSSFFLSLFKKSYLAILAIMLLSINSYGKETFTWTSGATNANTTYLYTYNNSTSITYSVEASNNVGYIKPYSNLPLYYIYREAYLFNISTFPSYGTATKATLTFQGGANISTSQGKLYFRKIAQNWQTLTNENAYKAIGSGDILGTSPTLTTEGEYSISTDPLKYAFQAAISSSSTSLGIGVQNTLESSSCTDCWLPTLTILYTIPTPGPVINLTATSVTQTSYLLSWTPPAVTSTCAAATEYIVKVGSSTYTTTTSTSVLITGLCPGVSRQLRVIPKNFYGNGDENSVLVTPTSSTISGPNYVCSSGTYFSLANVPSGSTVTWSTSSNVTIVSSSSSGITVISNGSLPGSGNISATVQFGSCSQIVSKTVWAGIPQSPMVDNDYINASINTIFYVNIIDSPGANPDSGIWSTFGNVTFHGNTYGASTSFYSASTDATGTIYVYTSNTCGVSSSTMITVITGTGGDDYELPEFEPLESGLSISPNPSTDIVTISIGSLDKAEAVKKLKLEIFNLNSIIVKTCYLVNPKDQISISDLPSGCYILVLTTSKEKLKGKLIIKR
jgi:hypothetical protein